MPTTSYRIDHDASISFEQQYQQIRNLTEQLAEPLSAEDQTVQSMADVSPTKWHRAHTTWFFETFLLSPYLPGYHPFHPAYGYLFNSYYETVGARHPRPDRGHLSRPGIEEIGVYRQSVDEAMHELLGKELDSTAIELVELGLNHEQQHQELLLMDIKHVLSRNPLRPAYREVPRLESRPPVATSPEQRSPRWIDCPGGLVEAGYDGDGFAFDNERPRHLVHLEPYALADRPISCGDWLEFIADGGYRRPELWLSEGWTFVQSQAQRAPMYWFDEDGEWSIFSLTGPGPIDPDEPVCHITYYEADAFAHWAGCRLPTEFEWEAAAGECSARTHLLELDVLHPRAPEATDGARGLFGDVWEWTASSYLPYPGFQAAEGSVGEYNGKFMISQQVLRGGCCVTPSGHVRPTYRNFFPPGAQWAFSGARLAANR